MTSYREISELYRTEAPLLQRFLRRFGPAVSSEDIAQESFSRLCALDPGTVIEPRAYLFRTAHNLALNALRRHNASPLRPARDSDLDAAVATCPTPEETAVAADELAHLRAALGTLPEHQRTALLLFRLEGWSHRAIGARMGVSHRTVERYIADAIAHCHLALRAR